MSENLILTARAPLEAGQTEMRADLTKLRTDVMEQLGQIQVELARQIRPYGR